MEHPEETTPEAVCVRLSERQPLWLLWDENGTYLAAGLEGSGPVLLAWTTRDEMDVSLRRLGAQAPDLVRLHHPIQRSVREVFETAYRLGCRLRIDQYMVEGFHIPLPAEDGR
jgi:hypothetical protein